jgi:hypothetical protein
MPNVQLDRVLRHLRRLLVAARLKSWLHLKERQTYLARQLVRALLRKLRTF